MPNESEEYDRMAHNLTNHSIENSTARINVESIRSEAISMAATILDFCPASRERSLALTNLEQTVMWSVASVARNQKEEDA